MLKISEAPIQAEVVTSQRTLTPALARHLMELKNAIIELEERVIVLENSAVINEAPQDGQKYVRKDGQWVSL